MALAGRGKAVGPPGELRIWTSVRGRKGDNAMMQRRAGVPPIPPTPWPTPGCAARRGRRRGPAPPRPRSSRRRPRPRPGADVRPVRGEVGEGDRAADPVTLVPTGHAADDVAVDPHRLGAEGHGETVVEHQAPQSSGRAGRLHRGERIPADEAAGLVEADGEAQAGLVRVLLGRDVDAPHPVALLDPEGVDGPVAAGHQAVSLACRPEPRPRGRPRNPSGSRAPSPARPRRSPAPPAPAPGRATGLGREVREGLVGQGRPRSGAGAGPGPPGPRGRSTTRRR